MVCLALHLVPLLDTVARLSSGEPAHLPGSRMDT